jgi:hypothetical protein
VPHLGAPFPSPPDFELIDDRRAGKIVVELNGRINKCGCISPRYDIQHQEIEAWVGRVLPSRLFGVLILTTSNGIMDHEEVRVKTTPNGAVSPPRALTNSRRAPPLLAGTQEEGGRQGPRLRLLSGPRPAARA